MRSLQSLLLLCGCPLVSAGWVIDPGFNINSLPAGVNFTALTAVGMDEENREVVNMRPCKTVMSIHSFYGISKVFVAQHGEPGVVSFEHIDLYASSQAGLGSLLMDAVL